MSSVERQLAELRLRVWAARDRVAKKQQENEMLRNQLHGDELQHQLRNIYEETEQLRKERDQLQETADAWKQVARATAKEVYDRGLAISREEAKHNQLKLTGQKLIQNVSASQTLFEALLKKIVNTRSAHNGGGDGAATRSDCGTFGSPLSSVGRGAAQGLPATGPEDASLHEARARKQAKVEQMLRLVDERVLPALARSTSLPLPFKIILKEMHMLAEREAQLRAELVAAGLQPERAITMSDREAQVYCVQRAVATIRARLDERKALAVEERERERERWLTQQANSAASAYATVAATAKDSELDRGATDRALGGPSVTSQELVDDDARQRRPEQVQHRPEQVQQRTARDHAPLPSGESEIGDDISGSMAFTQSQVDESDLPPQRARLQEELGKTRGRGTRCPIASDEASPLQRSAYKGAPVNDDDDDDNNDDEGVMTETQLLMDHAEIDELTQAEIFEHDMSASSRNAYSDSGNRSPLF